MSIRMQLVLTNHFEYSAIILNFRGEGDCHQHPSYKKYSINQYFNHICTQVWILCSSFECVFKMFFGRNTACFQCFFDRNTCKVCKCPRERHDIYNENFVNIRDRLGWKRNDDPSVQVSKDRTLREGYTWIPPGLSSEQVN